MCRPRCTSFATRAILRIVILSPTTGNNASTMVLASTRFHGCRSHRQPLCLGGQVGAVAADDADDAVAGALVGQNPDGLAEHQVFAGEDGAVWVDDVCFVGDPRPLLRCVLIG
jgi:hypothetical protein